MINVRAAGPMRLEPMPLVVIITISLLLGIVFVTGLCELSLRLLKRVKRRRYMQNLKVLISMYKNIVDTLGKDNDYSKIRYRKVVNRVTAMSRENMITKEQEQQILQEVNNYDERQ